ncbi:NlpC/P60 family protein [Lentzea sp. JNUCC 0626]|uniref:NlpC/P60 family protein n=1 Tax=Lentzea sp. JNUCC 0626 TaxID=3367513 RepID=UPI00374A8D46
MPAQRRLLPIALTSALVAVAVAPASAQPAQDPLARYNELGAQAAKTNEDLLKAREDLTAKRAELAKADEAEKWARSEEDRFRGQVDALTTASFEGARLTKLSAMLVADSQQDFLERMSAMDLIAADNAEALTRLATAVTTAEGARQQAQEATQAAEKLVGEVEGKQKELDGKIKEVKAALGALDPSVRNGLSRVKDNGSYLGPPGAANTALQAALSKRGSLYLWGGTGPDRFDCSGLMLWAYKQAGITLPRVAAAQFNAGRAVPLDALVAGDLLFYDDGTGNPATIHHVAMYVGEGKMVDSPTDGQVVDIRSSRGDGHLMGARRIAG